MIREPSFWVFMAINVLLAGLLVWMVVDAVVHARRAHAIERSARRHAAGIDDMSWPTTDPRSRTGGPRR